MSLKDKRYHNILDKQKYFPKIFPFYIFEILFQSKNGEVKFRLGSLVMAIVCLFYDRPDSGHLKA